MEYQLIAFSKYKFKTICNTELKIHKVSKQTFFETLEYLIDCEKTVQNRPELRKHM